MAILCFGHCACGLTVAHVALQAVRLCRDLVDAMMGEMLQFDLRNGALRKKYDALKYTLRKMENVLYELSLLQGGVVRQDGGEVRH